MFKKMIAIEKSLISIILISKSSKVFKCLAKKEDRTLEASLANRKISDNSEG